MEISSAVFIATIIAGSTEAVKNLFPGKVYGILTVITAVLVGVGVALLDTSMGLDNISIAQGVTIALGTVGAVGTVSKIG